MLRWATLEISSPKGSPATLARGSDTTRRDFYPRRRDRRSKQADSRNEDLRQLLFELALALLPLGITPSSFSKLAREAFIRAAAGHARLRNGKVNHSKVAALTGLPRKNIRRILNHPSVSGLESDAATGMPSERVVRGWLTNKRFLTRNGRPKTLLISRGTLSFDRLVKDHAGDVSPRAVLEELMRSRTVRRTRERLALQTSKLPPTRNGLGLLERVIPTLVDGLRIASCQSASVFDSTHYRLSLQAATEAELTLIRQRCSSAVHSLLHGLRESLEHELTTPIRKRPSTHALTLTVLLADTLRTDKTVDARPPR